MKTREASIVRASARLVECLALLAAGVFFQATSAGPTNTSYTYDELGRLRTVTVEGDDTRTVTYTYDAAGNRKELSTTNVPGMPASITVPSTSTSGTYTINWGTAAGTVTAYKLFEAGNSNFTGETEVYSGGSGSTQLSGRGNGTYYYRVRACNGALCGPHRVGGNPTQVTLPPGIPASISVPSSSTTGNYSISWGASSGTLDVYELYEATNSGFSAQTLVYSGANTSTNLSGRGNGTYYYRVRACYLGVCSDYRTGSNATTVTLPPGIPASISVPASGTSDGYTISWGTSTGTFTAYELYEATNASFSGQSLVYNSTGTSTLLTGRSPGSYYYRVRACNGPACSDYRTGSNHVGVALPIQVTNPTVQVQFTGQTTGISVLANMNGHAGTIHSFSMPSCPTATVQIQGGAQSVVWNHSNSYYYQCEGPSNDQCSASYVIRNTATGQTYPGTASVVVVDQPIELPPGQQCN
jgi:YD repeat-containing protein